MKHKNSSVYKLCQNQNGLCTNQCPYRNTYPDQCGIERISITVYGVVLNLQNGNVITEDYMNEIATRDRSELKKVLETLQQST